MDRSERATGVRAQRALTAALVAAVAVLAFSFACEQIYDPDFWWHLAIGRWVLEHRAIPRQDVFSFATAGAPWVPHSWLPDVGMFVLHRLAGISGVILFKAALVAAAFGTGTWLAIRSGIHPWLAALAYAAVIPVARFQFRERPQTVMFALVAMFFWLLGEREAERRRRTWILLVAGTLMWANFHGSFFLGLVLAGALVLERGAAWTLTAATGPGEARRRLLLAGALLLTLSLTTLATPFGIRLPMQMLEDFSSYAVTRAAAIQEYQPLEWAKYVGFSILLAATAASFLAAGRRARLYSAAAFVAFNWLALRSVRFVGIAAMLDAGVLAQNLQPLVERAAALGWSFKPRVQAAALGPLLVLGMALAFRNEFRPGKEARFGLGVNEGRFPRRAVEYLASSGFEGNLFNDWQLGGYVLWHLPAAKTLVDGRALPAHFEVLDRLASLPGPDDVKRWLAGHDVKGALLMRSDGWGDFFAHSAEYERVFFDDRALVYLRKDVAARAGTATAKYRYIQPDTFDPSYLVPLAQGPHAAEVEAELRAAVAESPDVLAARFMLGFFLEVKGSPEALEQYLAAARINASLAFAHYRLGARLVQVGTATRQFARVEPVLREALKMNPKDAESEAYLAFGLYTQGRLAESEEGFERALARAPNQLIALTNLGYLYVDTKRAASAVPLFERAAALAPRDENAAYGFAYALQASGDRRRAARAWRAFLDGFPGSAWVPRARAGLAACER